MDTIESLTAAEDIRNLKAQYCRGVDTKDAALLGGVFAEDAVADYRGGLVDPTTGVGVDQGRSTGGRMIEPLRGGQHIADSIVAAVQNKVTVHHCATGEIHIDGPDSAHAVWPMVDRLLYPPGSEAKELIGYGFYEETYVRRAGAWKINTVKLVRTRVDVIPF